MIISKKFLMTVGLLFAVGAGAAAFNGPFAFIHKIPGWLQGGVYIGTAQPNTDNKITRTSAGLRTWDFGALGGGLINCEDAAAVAVTTGTALAGDPCFVSDNFGQDGGASLPLEASVTCKVTTPNNVTVRMCAFHADAGTMDLLDGGFMFRTFSAR